MKKPEALYLRARAHAAADFLSAAERCEGKIAAQALKNNEIAETILCKKLFLFLYICTVYFLF